MGEKYKKEGKRRRWSAPNYLKPLYTHNMMPEYECIDISQVG